MLETRQAAADAIIAKFQLQKYILKHVLNLFKWFKYLFEFRELWETLHGREADVDHAERLQLCVLVRQTFDHDGLGVVQVKIDHLKIKKYT